jgi:HK97 family phage portal protein
VRNAKGQPEAIYPLHPHKTTPKRAVDKSIIYVTSDGQPDTTQPRTLQASDVLHIPLWSFDGLMGLSPIAAAKQGIGLSRAAEKYGARFFGNGSRPGGILTPKNALDETTASQVKESWQAMQGGINQGKIAVLPGGDWSYTAIGLSPDDSQFLATRKFQREELCSLFRIPPRMVGDVTRSTGKNYEQEALGFVTETLRPYISRFEQEITRKLLPVAGRNSGRYHVQFDVRELLRCDFQAQNAGYALGRQWGYLTANMILAELGENPVGPAGDILWAPVNMQNAENLLPGHEPAQPTQAERQLLGQYTNRFLVMWRDAVRRIIARDKRDSVAISQVFTPVLTAIVEHICGIVAPKFGLDTAWKTTDRAVAGVCAALERQVAKWSPDEVDTIAGETLTLTVRALHISTTKEAAEARAVKEVDK